MKSATPVPAAFESASLSVDGPVSAWCVSGAKRGFDFVLAGAMLTALAPAMLLIALLVRLSSRGPVLFRQRRVGQGGEVFWLLKFRTMAYQPLDPGLAVTRSGDSRITRVGRWLRKSKLDELPQLVNVISGDMSLVGPRPDVPEYYQLLDSACREVLRLRPGLTGAASIQFRNEEELLAQVPPAELVSFYTGTLLPRKVRTDLAYARRASLFTDLGILFRTAGAIFVRELPAEQRAA